MTTTKIFCDIKTRNVHLNDLICVDANKINEEMFLHGLYFQFCCCIFNILIFFILALPDSALAREKAGRGTAAEVAKAIESLNKQPTPKSLSCPAQSCLEMSLQQHIDWNFGNLEATLPDLLSVAYTMDVAVNLSKSIEICRDTIDQHLNDFWKSERNKRITGSRCYELFTYINNNHNSKDWDRKVTSFLTPIRPTADMLYGSENEKTALLQYEALTGKTVSSVGLVIPPNVPFIACSPDGLVADENTLIEVKCPKMGKTKKLIEFVPLLPFWDKSKLPSLVFKKKHKYYAQIQISIYILQSKSCDFVVFSQIDGCQIVRIAYDEEYAKKLVQDLYKAYFLKIIPRMYDCENLIWK